MTEGGPIGKIVEGIDTLRWDIVNAGYKKSGLKALERETRQAAENPTGYTHARMNRLDSLSLNEHTDPFHYYSSTGYQVEKIKDVLATMPTEERVFFRWYRAGNQNMMYRFSREEILRMIKGKLEKLQK